MQLNNIFSVLQKTGSEKSWCLPGEGSLSGQSVKSLVNTQIGHCGKISGMAWKCWGPLTLLGMDSDTWIPKGVVKWVKKHQNFRDKLSDYILPQTVLAGIFSEARFGAFSREVIKKVLLCPVLDEIEFRLIIQEGLCRLLPKLILRQVAPKYESFVDAKAARVARLALSTLFFALSKAKTKQKDLSGKSHQEKIQNAMSGNWAIHSAFKGYGLAKITEETGNPLYSVMCNVKGAWFKRLIQLSLTAFQPKLENWVKKQLRQLKIQLELGR